MIRIDTDIQILNMNGGKRNAKIRDYMKKEAVYQPYVEKTPDYFSFFLDVDFKKSSKFVTQEQKLNCIDLWFPEQERWIAVCTEWKGFHIIFPNLPCTKESALQLFSTLQNPDNILDASVYKTGLRILFAPKPNEHRCYVPYQKRTGNVVEVLEEKMYPEFFITQPLPDAVKQKQQLTHVPRRVNSKVTFKKSGDRIFMYTYERNCRNLKQGVHRSNHIYYEIKGKNKYQRCWCDCETKENRKHGYCKNFISDPIPIGWKEAKQIELYLKN